MNDTMTLPPQAPHPSADTPTAPTPICKIRTDFSLLPLLQSSYSERTSRNVCHDSPRSRLAAAAEGRSRRCTRKTIKKTDEKIIRAPARQMQSQRFNPS